jgi:hypothetical protein
MAVGPNQFQQLTRVRYHIAQDKKTVDVVAVCTCEGELEFISMHPQLSLTGHEESKIRSGKISLILIYTTMNLISESISTAETPLTYLCC